MEALPNSQVLIAFLEATTRQWHRRFPSIEDARNPNDPFLDLAVSIHHCNFFQWDREEKVRRRDLSPDAIVVLKREIDDSNMARAKLVESMDEFCVSRLNLVDRADWSDLYINSETLGQLADRISILVLKIFFTEQHSQRNDLESALRELCSQRVARLRPQLKYVAACYDRFLSHLVSGTGYMPAYKQFKIYEDKDLTR